MTLDLGPYITRAETVCHHCERPMPDTREWQTLLNIFNSIRQEYGSPLTLNSTYRCPRHPAESRKPDGPGMHNTAAMDISIHRRDAVRLLRIICGYPSIKGLGVQSKGLETGRFIHIDTRDTPRLWSY